MEGERSTIGVPHANFLGMAAQGLRFKSVDRNVVDHPVERRGFVQVPLDYDQPDKDTIEIFYRMLPAHASSANDRSKPVIVIFNGGPGIPSSDYRPLGYDYDNPSSPKNGSRDPFKYLLRTHRVLLIDQRGTDGQSAPLDMDFPDTDARTVARLFSSDSMARDFLAVIDAVIPKEDPFYVIAQSFGGLPGMQYLALSEKRRPNAMIFSCSALPHMDLMPNLLARRREQLKLNLQLRQACPDIEQKLGKARARVESLGLDPVHVDGLFAWLGRGTPGEWEKKLLDKLDVLTRQSRDEIEDDPEYKYVLTNLLNLILCTVNFTPGNTDRVNAQITSEQLPFESWMLDENRVMMMMGRDGTWQDRLLEGIERDPLPVTPFPSIEELRRSISGNRVVFVAGENDGFNPPEAYLQTVGQFLVEGSTEVLTLPGGHGAIFQEPGQQMILSLE